MRARRRPPNAKRRLRRKRCLAANPSAVRPRANVQRRRPPHPPRRRRPLPSRTEAPAAASSLASNSAHPASTTRSSGPSTRTRRRQPRRARRRGVTAETLRRRAREIASEGSGSRGVLNLLPPPPPVEKKDHLAEDIAKAAKPDCRTPMPAWVSSRSFRSPRRRSATADAGGSCLDEGLERQARFTDPLATTAASSRARGGGSSSVATPTGRGARPSSAGRQIHGRPVVAAQELQMAEGKRRQVQQIAQVARESRERRGKSQASRRRRDVHAAQRGQVFAQRARRAAAQLDVARSGARRLRTARRSPRPRREHPARRCGRARRPARSGSAAARAREASARRKPPSPSSNDGRTIVHAQPRGANRAFAAQLRDDEPAARVVMQPQRRHMDERRDARARAGRAQRGRRPMVDAIVGRAAALAQDADAVHHRIDIAHRVVPLGRRRHRFEAHDPPLAAARLREPCARRLPPRADDHAMTALGAAPRPRAARGSPHRPAPARA